MDDQLSYISALLPDLIKGVTTLFIVVDPLGNIPIFMSLTEKMSRRERGKAFHTATVTGLILLLIFAFVGQQILNLFGISIHSFMIAGGILLLIIYQFSYSSQRSKAKRLSLLKVLVQFPSLVHSLSVQARLRLRF